MKTLWIATANDKKRVELERLLGGLDYRLRTLADAPVVVEIVEDGDTFAANAEIKATVLARAVGGLAIGDDSGLCVDALGGRPGVRSARYGGPGADDNAKIAKLLDELAGRAGPARRAHFTCHICLADQHGVLARFEAHCHGSIANAPHGGDGFGYDPIFVADAHAETTPTRSFADLTAVEKDAISHRGQALRQLVEFLRRRD